MTMEHPAVEDVFPNENGSSNVMLVFRSVITCVLSWIEVILVDPQNKSQSEVGRFDVHEFNESTLISHKPGLCKKRLISILDVRSSFSFRINMARSKKTAMQLTNSLQKSYVVTEATSQTQKSFNCPFPFQQWIWHTPTSTQLLLHLTFFPIQPRNLASQASRGWLEVALLLAIGPQWIRWNYDGWIVPRGGFKNSTLSES